VLPQVRFLKKKLKKKGYEMETCDLCASFKKNSKKVGRVQAMGGGIWRGQI